MAFALRTGVAPSVLPRGQSRRQMVCRAGKFDEELMKTAVSRREAGVGQDSG